MPELRITNHSDTAASFLTRALDCNCSCTSLRILSFPANCFRRTEVKFVKKTCNLAQVWRQSCSCCHNCSEHNRNCPVWGKITPAEVAGSTWGSVCVPGACPRCQRHRRQWAWLRHQQASSNFRLTASLLKWPFASAANATSERTVSQRKHRKRYGTFALRNAWLIRPMSEYNV